MSAPTKRARKDYNPLFIEVTRNRRILQRCPDEIAEQVLDEPAVAELASILGTNPGPLPEYIPYADIAEDLRNAGWRRPASGLRRPRLTERLGISMYWDGVALYHSEIPNVAAALNLDVGRHVTSYKLRVTLKDEPLTTLEEEG